MAKFIDKIPLLHLAFLALLLGLAPFVPEPHLVVKIRWLIAGLPFKSIDWLDLAMHGALLLPLTVKIARMVSHR